MSIGEALLLGVVQGLAEFLPISSSGHMTLIEMAFGMTETSEMLTLDVAMHAATLLVIVAYFARAWIATIRKSPELVFLVGFACVPAVAFYLGLGFLVTSAKGSLISVSVGFLATALFLILAHYKSKGLAESRQHRIAGDLDKRRSILDVLIIGVAQAAALFPGVSRSGSTISAGVLRGVDRYAAFEFSFLVGSPLMFGAVLLEGRNIAAMAEMNAAPVVVGFAAAVVSGFAALVALKRVVIANKLWLFGIYAGVLGAACLLVGIVRLVLADRGSA